MHVSRSDVFYVSTRAKIVAVRVVYHRDHRSAFATAAPAEGGQAKLLHVFIGEANRSHNEPRYDAIVEEALLSQEMRKHPARAPMMSRSLGEHRDL